MSTPLDGIRVDRLTARDGRRAVLGPLSWSVPEGSVVGLLGPGGAGKTMLFRLLLGIIRMTGGSAAVTGVDVAADPLVVRRRAVLVPQDRKLDSAMRVDRFLSYLASFYPDYRPDTAARLLVRWSISPDARLGALDDGAKTKLLVASALAREPRVLLLDEPVTTLDPVDAQELMGALTDWMAGGTRTVVIAARQPDAFERIADRAAVLVAGRLRLSGDLDELRAGWKRIGAIGLPPHMELAHWPGVEHVYREGETAWLVTRETPEATIARVRDAGGTVHLAADMNLRDIYLTLVRRQSGNNP